MTLPCYLGSCPTLPCVDPPCPLPPCDGASFECAIPVDALYRKGVLPPEPLLHMWPPNLPLRWADKPAGFITVSAKQGAKWAKKALEDYNRCRILALRCQMMSLVLSLETVNAAYPEALGNDRLHRLQCEDAVPSCGRYLKSLQRAHLEKQKYSKYNWGNKCSRPFREQCPPHSQNGKSYR